MKLKIQKWGDRAALKLPAKMLSKIGATIGDTVVEYSHAVDHPVSSKLTIRYQ
jgi:antitoxin component of MazEF toxin-antitoxin module